MIFCSELPSNEPTKHPNCFQKKKSHCKRTPINSPQKKKEKKKNIPSKANNIAPSLAHKKEEDDKTISEMERIVCARLTKNCLKSLEIFFIVNAAQSFRSYITGNTSW